MEDKKLVRVFDQVKLSPKREEAMLADLLRTKEEVSSMKQKRRIPAAALVAAALVVILTGTALAEGYFGRMEVSPVKGDFENGYSVWGGYQNIPSERLSGELLERAARIGGGHEDVALGSWSEAEEFIGLEVADNAILEGIAPENRTQCTVDVSYSLGLPDMIWLYTQYWGDDLSECSSGLMVSAFMRVKAEGHGDQTFRLGNHNSQTAVEEYVTPNGMKATIFSGGYDVVTRVGTYQQPSYSVYFPMNDAIFWIRTEFNEENADTVLNGLKRVLDAFE